MINPHWTAKLEANFMISPTVELFTISQPFFFFNSQTSYTARVMSGIVKTGWNYKF